jgi:tetratricopeptide (TPR) repeat protein
VEVIRFVFWEAAKVLGLALLGLVCSKGVAALTVRRGWVKHALYALILALAGLGAWYAGNDVAAEVYMWSSNSNLAQGDLVKAYANAVRAVSLRPNNLGYWHTLIQCKMRLQQLQSVLDDEPAVRALSNGNFDEGDEYQFALCWFFLGRYDQVLGITQRLARQNPGYAAPQVMQGMAYTAEGKYQEAERSYLAVLQIFPTNQAAVEGLARACYLGGDRRRAKQVLDETEKFPFPPLSRERFEALKGLYDQ